jgi:hypothetical protein
MESNKYVAWSLTFTKKVVLLVTLLWFLQLIYSAVMICLAIDMYGNFSYLDTFITDNGETFRLIVGANIVSKTIENVFKYNEGGIFGKSISQDGIQDEASDENGVG